MKDKITLSFNLKTPLISRDANLLNTDFWRFLTTLSFAVNNARILETITVSDTEYNANWNTDLIMCDTSLNPITINLPSASILQNKPLTIKCINSSNNVTIIPFSGETIDGSLSVTISAYNSITVLANANEIWSV